MTALGLQDLPAVNAALNGASAVSVIAALACIKRGHESAHKRLMLLAVVISAAFLVSYVVYHTSVDAKTTAWDGWLRIGYLAMLASHVILAIAVVPLVLITVLRGLRDDRPRHRRIARWTVPIWLYVSVTGVLVYFCVHVWQ